MSLVVAIAIALVAILVAWKVFKGMIKTVALLAILVLAAIFVFGVHH